MTTFIGMLVSVFVGVSSGVILSFWNDSRKRKQEEETATESLSEESEYVKLSLLCATAQLSRAVAIAYKRGYANGEVEEGLAQYENAMARFRELERKIIAKGE